MDGTLLFLPEHTCYTLDGHDMAMQVDTKATGTGSTQSPPAEWLEVAQSQVSFFDKLNDYQPILPPSELHDASCYLA
jgi:hypothetical protein